MERPMVYAMFDAASLAILTPSDVDSLTRRMPAQVANEFRLAWESALAKFRPSRPLWDIAMENDS